MSLIVTAISNSIFSLPLFFLFYLLLLFLIIIVIVAINCTETLENNDDQSQRFEYANSSENNVTGSGKKRSKCRLRDSNEKAIQNGKKRIEQAVASKRLVTASGNRKSKNDDNCGKNKNNKIFSLSTQLHKHVQHITLNLARKASSSSSSAQNKREPKRRPPHQHKPPKQHVDDNNGLLLLVDNSVYLNVLSQEKRANENQNHSQKSISSPASNFSLTDAQAQSGKSKCHHISTKSFLVTGSEIVPLNRPPNSKQAIDVKENGRQQGDIVFSNLPPQPVRGNVAVKSSAPRAPSTNAN